MLSAYLFRDIACAYNATGRGMRLFLRLTRNIPGFRVKWGLSCMSGPLGRLGAAATLGQHCPQMTQRPGMTKDSRNAILSTLCPIVSVTK